MDDVDMVFSVERIDFAERSFFFGLTLLGLLVVPVYRS